MPEYSFNCSECDLAFSKIWSISEYDCKTKRVKCPECKSKKVFRDFSEDRITPNYVKGIHEVTTLGEYADKQTKRLGKAKVEQMRLDQKTKKDPKTGLKELPTGMSRVKDYTETPRLSKSEIQKRRNSK